jgi:hypothetical protein
VSATKTTSRGGPLRFAGRGDLAGFGVAHLVQEANGLFADLQQPAFDLDDIAGQQFPLVADVLLHRGHAAAGFAQIGRRQPYPREQIPVGLVEFADIPHDVHVADMIALPRIDRAAIGGCRFHRSLPPFILDTVAYQSPGGLAIRYRIKNR